MRTGGRQEPYTYGSLPGKEDFYFEDFKRLSRAIHSALPIPRCVVVSTRSPRHSRIEAAGLEQE